MEKYIIKRRIVVEEEVTYKRYIALKIIQFRKQQKLTQEDLANMMGISRVSVVNIERGRQALSIKNLYLICDVLHVKSSQLLPF